MNKSYCSLWKLFLIAISCVAINDVTAQSYQTIHKKASVIDGHNSILTAVEDSSYSFDQNLSGKTQSDLQRMIKGGVDVQVFSIWYDGEKPALFAKAISRIDTLNAWSKNNSRRMMIVRTPVDLSEAIKKNKLGAIIAVEGGQMMENDMTKLDSFFKRGVRLMTLTNEQSLPWATSARDETNDSSHHQPKGLNDFGKQVVRRMNELGMIVDVSHVGEQTISDAITITTKPIIASHSCVYNLCPTHFNLKDEQIKAIAKNGGLVMISFWPGMLDSSWGTKARLWEEQHKKEIDSISKINPDGADQYLNLKYKNDFLGMDQIPISKLIDHIDYIVKLVGADYVGLGSSFEGMNALWQGLNGNGVLDYPQITKALLEKGYNKKDIEKILGGNFIRVFKANVQ